MSAHRAEGPANTQLPPSEYRPRHCAGTDCLHSHPGQRPTPTFAGLHVPAVLAQCGRRHDHGAHDTTAGRCPGLVGTGVPSMHGVAFARAARAALRGGATS